MPSQIDPTKPITISPTTASVRTNFQFAKDEIEALQQADIDHIAAADPHPQYLTSAEADTLYDAIGLAGGVQFNLDSHTANVANPHAVTAIQAGADALGTAAAEVATHEGLPDPHNQYAFAADLGIHAADIEAHNLAKNNLTSAFDPTPADDDTQGYSRNSVWINTLTATVFTCADPVTGTAVWIVGGGIGEAPVDGTPYVRQDAGWISESGGGGGSQLMIVQDQKPNGIVGGTFTTGARRTRDLNTVLVNEIAGASLAANQITLPAGTFRVQASAPGYKVARHKITLVDITNTLDLIHGSIVNSDTTSNSIIVSVLNSQFVLTGATVIELHHECQTTVNSNGFGQDNQFGTEAGVFSQVIIEKVA